MNCWYFCTSLFHFINCWLTWWLQNSCLQNQSRSDNRISMKYGRGFTPMKPVMYIFSLSVQWRVAWFIISLHPILFLSNQRNPSLGLSDIRRNKSFLLFAIPSATGNKNNFQQNCSCIIHLFALLHKKTSLIHFYVLLFLHMSMAAPIVFLDFTTPWVTEAWDTQARAKAQWPLHSLLSVDTERNRSF